MGKTYDRFGLAVVLVAVVLSALFAPIALASHSAVLVIYAGYGCGRRRGRRAQLGK